MLIVPVCGAGGPHLARVLSLTVLENSSTADQNKTAAFLNTEYVASTQEFKPLNVHPYMPRLHTTSRLSHCKKTHESLRNKTKSL